MSDHEVWRDQIAVVTGGAGSIGAAVVTHLHALGARVASADLTVPDSGTDRLRHDRVDVTDSASVDRWIGEIAEAWGAPTIGVICAGISKPGRLIDTPDEDWADVVKVNLTGAFFTARAVIRSMLAAEAPGRLVLIGSWAAAAPHPHIGAYSASKAGLRALCKTLALDHARDGILVNEVAPGIVDAGLSRELFRRDLDLATRTLAAIPAGQLLQPEDVARDVAFLVSPGNRHTTGAVLTTDDGISLASTMNTGRTRK